MNTAIEVYPIILEPFGDDLREFGEFADAVIDGVVERANIDFKGIAGIDHHHRFAVIVVTLIEPALQGQRLDERRAAFFRLDQRMLHGDDLGLELDQHAVERLVLGLALLDFDIGKARIGAQPAEKRVDIGAFAGQKQIDAFRAQNDGAAQIVFLTKFQELRTFFDRIAESDEFVRGDIDVRSGWRLHD